MPGLKAYPLIWAATIGVALVCCAPVWADSVRLKDGTRFEGTLIRQNDLWVITLADGKKVTIRPDQVAAMEVVGPKTALSVPEERLASLRRAVENVPDLKQVVDRYKAFAKQYEGTPVGEQAKADLAIWQDRLDRKLTKFADKWVSEEERKQIAEHSMVSAEEAMALLQQGRFNDAAPVVDKALSESSQNAAAWYLRGLVSWKQDRTVDARKAFEQVTAMVPDLAAGHNNLAIVLWRQNQHVAALLSYDKGLLAAPDSMFILDNMAEALHALPEDLRTRTTVAKVVHHFNDQEALARQRMEAIGMYRWGSTWVPKTEIDRLSAIEKEIRARVDRMEVDYNAITGRVRQLDGDIQAAEQTIRRMEADSYVLDPSTGRYVRYALPPSYYTFVRDIGTMKGEREQRVKEKELMRAQARQLVQGLPTPRYTGAQRMVETEGTPIIGKPAAPPVVAAAPPLALPPVPAVPPVAPAAPVTPAGLPATQPAPVTPVEPAPVTQLPPAELGRPRRPIVPPEKPSILDRRFADPPPPPVDQPLLDEKPGAR